MHNYSWLKITAGLFHQEKVPRERLAVLTTNKSSAIRSNLQSEGKTRINCKYISCCWLGSWAAQRFREQSNPRTFPLTEGILWCWPLFPYHTKTIIGRERRQKQMERHLPARANLPLISRPVLGLSHITPSCSTKLYCKRKMSKETETCISIHNSDLMFWFMNALLVAKIGCLYLFV